MGSDPCQSRCILPVATTSRCSQVPGVPAPQPGSALLSCDIHCAPDLLLCLLCSPPQPQGKGLPGMELAELFLSPKALQRL